MGNAHTADLSELLALMTSFKTYVAGAVQLYLDATEYDTAATSFEKQAEVTIPALIADAEFRVSCEAKPTISPKRVEVAIYKNGVILSTVQEVSGVSWEALTWDLSPWDTGDTIEVWIRGLDAPQTSNVRNFKISTGVLVSSSAPTWV